MRWPIPALRGANQLLNASAALAALEALRDAPAGAARRKCARAWRWWNCRAASRCCRAGRPVILDVAHNPHAAATLAQNLGNMGFHRYTYAVFGVMHDKDIDGVIAQMSRTSTTGA